MGFDLYGIKPKTGKGEYFRNNVWSWRPLWRFCEVVAGDILTNKDIIGGSYNDGYLITKPKSVLLGDRLQTLLEDEKQFKKYQKQIDKDTGEVSEGFHTIFDKLHGDKPKKMDNPYKGLLTRGNVREFAKFCLESRGFRIY